MMIALDELSSFYDMSTEGLHTYNFISYTLGYLIQDFRNYNHNVFVEVHKLCCEIMTIDTSMVYLCPHDIFPVERFPVQLIVTAPTLDHPHPNIIMFQDDEECSDFLQMYTSIKRRINDTNYFYEKDMINATQRVTWMQNTWVPLVSDFITLFTKWRVPTDVRSAFNDVRINVGYEEYDFPSTSSENEN